MGGLIGLKYESVIAVIELHINGKKSRRRIFEDVQAIEHGYLSRINKNGK